MRLIRPRTVAVWPGAPPPSAHVLGVATASGLVTAGGRDDLQLGVDQPTALNTGPIIPEASLTDVTGDPIIYTTPQTLTFKRFLGRVHIRCSGMRFENCVFRGGTTTPSDGDGLANCTNASCTNAYFQDCEFYPQFVHWNWDSGVVGHDFTLDRCHIHHTTDGVNVYNTTIGGVTPYNTNVVIKQSLIEKLAYWTASTGGVVHSDFATHNDGIQHQGGLGSQILGNALYGWYARQYGHWVETSTALAEASITEPFTGVALTSLPAGNPWYGGPFQASTSGGNTIPDTGSGTWSTGRYNIGGAKWQTGNTGSLAALLIGDEVGPSGNLVIEDNWFYGGDFAVNGGGAVNTGGAYNMFFRRNKFDHTQGSPTRSVNTDTTQTINFQQSGSSWAGHVTAPTTGADRNYYFDNNAAVTVRT